MHIEFVTDTYTPDVNGAAKTLASVVSHLKKADHRVTLVGPYAQSAVPVFSFRMPNYTAVNIGFIRAATFKKRWKECRPDIIYIAVETLMGMAAMRAANQLKIPVIAGYHTNFSQYAENWSLKYLEQPVIRHMRKFHNKAAATVVPSRSVMASLEQQGFDHLHLMGRGVDSELFNPSKRSSELRAMWGASSDTPVALFTSRVSPEKNLSLLSRAFKVLQEYNSDTRCVVVGDGPLYDRFERENQNVICSRFKHGEELAEIYASADMMLFPSMTETFGNTVTEALASGLVVVGYDYAAAEMHIKHEVNGLLADYGNEELFLQRCREALDVICDNAIRVEATMSVVNLTWEGITQQLIDIAEKIIDEHRK